MIAERGSKLVVRSVRQREHTYEVHVQAHNMILCCRDRRTFIVDMGIHIHERHGEAMSRGHLDVSLSIAVMYVTCRLFIRLGAHRESDEP